jgi:anti-anti-sigma factor
VGELDAANVEFEVSEGSAEAVVTIRGELDITGVDALARRVARLFERPPARLIVDAGDVRFADSSAIALWVRWASEVDDFELRDPSPLLRRVIEAMGLAGKLALSPVEKRQRFPADAGSVPAARRFATDTLQDASSDVREAVELMVSELATNGVRHGRTSFEVAIHRTETQIRVEVTDHGSGTPTMRSPTPDEPTGRGLRIVDLLSERWGVDGRDGGKTVWFTLASPTE